MEGDNVQRVAARIVKHHRQIKGKHLSIVSSS